MKGLKSVALYEDAEKGREVVPEDRLRCEAPFKEGDYVNIFPEVTRQWEVPHMIGVINYFADSIFRESIVPTYNVFILNEEAKMNIKNKRHLFVLLFGMIRICIHNAEADKALLRECFLSEADDISGLNAAIEAGVNVDYQSPYRQNYLSSLSKGFTLDDDYGFHYSLVHVACMRGCLPIISRLLDLKANCNCKTDKGVTPLCIASEQGHLLVSELLLNHGAEVNQPKEDGTTALSVASEIGYLSVCELLIKHGATINQAREDGATPLFVASERDHLSVCELLIKHGAAVNQVHSDGRTPLYVASEEGYLSVCEHLIKHGAGINQVDKDGVTPL